MSPYNFICLVTWFCDLTHIYIYIYAYCQQLILDSTLTPLLSLPTMPHKHDIYHYNDFLMSVMAYHIKSPVSSLAICNCWFRHKSKKTSKLRSASLAFVRGIHRWPVNSPHKRSVRRQKLSDAENASIWWRLHGISRRLLTWRNEFIGLFIGHDIYYCMLLYLIRVFWCQCYLWYHNMSLCAYKYMLNCQYPAMIYVCLRW